MYIPQPQEVGLPDVKDVVEISCLPGSKTVGHLREQIYDVAFSLTGNVHSKHRNLWKLEWLS